MARDLHLVVIKGSYILRTALNFATRGLNIQMPHTAAQLDAELFRW